MTFCQRKIKGLQKITCKLLTIKNETNIWGVVMRSDQIEGLRAALYDQ